MKALVLRLTNDAPSICPVDRSEGKSAARMKLAVIQQCVLRAKQCGLTLHVFVNGEGLIPAERTVLEGSSFICISPVGTPPETRYDCSVLDLDHQVADARLLTDRVIVKFSSSTICLVEPVCNGFPPSTTRVVLMSQSLRSRDMGIYETALEGLARLVEKRLRTDHELQINVLTDGFNQSGSFGCGAGSDHMTVESDGRLYQCMGQAIQGVDSIGDATALISDIGWSRLSANCDAGASFEWERCDLYKPPDSRNERCEMARKEREVSARLLTRLQSAGFLMSAAPLPPSNKPRTDGIVGFISEEDRNTLRLLEGRRRALMMLAAAGDLSVEIREQVESDRDRIAHDMATWWRSAARRYHWPGNHWRIDFETRGVLTEHCTCVTGTGVEECGSK